MPRSVQLNLPATEVDRVHRSVERSEDVVNKVHRLPEDLPLEMAKARMGAAIGAAIGDDPQRHYGHKSLISGVTRGEKVPDYLGRIYQKPTARRRLALALLDDDPEAQLTMTVTIPMKGGRR